MTTHYKKRRLKTIDLPYDGETLTFTIRSLTERELTTCMNSVYRNGKPIPGRQDELQVRLLIATLCDEQGEPVYTEAQLPDLMDWDAAITRPLASAVMEHLGIVPSVAEVAEKN